MNKSIIAFIMVLVMPAYAAAATITPGPLVISYDGDGTLFSENNLEPGARINKELTVTNNGRIAHNFAIATRNVRGDLASKIYISAIENNQILWTNNLLELQNLSTESKTITRLSSGQTKIVYLEAHFPEETDSTYKGKSVSFDLVYGTEELESASNFSVMSSDSATPIPSPAISQVASGEVKGEDTTSQDGVNPWYLLIAPAALLASIVFLPEFAVAGGLAAVGGGATYVLGYSSTGSMDFQTFVSILVVEIIGLIVIAYYILHHDNHTSRRIKAYKHRLRIR